MLYSYWDIQNFVLRFWVIARNTFDYMTILNRSIAMFSEAGNINMYRHTMLHACSKLTAVQSFVCHEVCHEKQDKYCYHQLDLQWRMKRKYHVSRALALTKRKEQYNVTTIPATSINIPPGQVKAANANGRGA